MDQPATGGRRHAHLNTSLQAALSTLVSDHGYTVQALVELVRGQTADDFRPNKALCPRRLAHLLGGYKFAGLVCSVAGQGIRPRWKTSALMLSHGAKNHQSANRHLNAVIKSVRRGQEAGQYLVPRTPSFPP
jgi:hypothetical protein